MDFRKITKTVALATIGVIITGTSAFAFAAKAQSALNVRSGPGTGYNIVDALYKGETVNVNKCTPSKKWCYVTHKGPDGWVAAKYLKKIGHKPKPKPTPTPTYEDPKVTFGFQFGSGGSSFTFGFSTDDGYTYPHKPRKAKVCFYSQKNYRGRKACVNAGKSNNLLPPKWNDRISSIQIIGDAAVKVCKHKNFKGICRTIDHDVPRLGWRLNNEISSYKSYRY